MQILEAFEINSKVTIKFGVLEDWIIEFCLLVTLQEDWIAAHPIVIVDELPVCESELAKPRKKIVPGEIGRHTTPYNSRAC